MSEKEQSSLDPLTIGDLITISEAAAKVDLNGDFLRQLAIKGRLRAKKSGSTWLTTLAAIEEYKASRHRGKRTDLEKKEPQ